MNFRKLLMCSITATLYLNSSATIKLHNTIGNHMVLQQESATIIKGKANPGEKITLKCSWEKKNFKTHCETDSTWSIKLQTPKGSFNKEWISLDGENHILLDDILIGDVWLCSGQSNMEMPLKGFPSQPVENSLELIMDSYQYKNLRLFEIPHRYSEIPEMECGGEWQISTPETAAEFSAIGYIFGSKLSASLNVPVGILLSSYGGSRIESWMTPESLEAFKEGIDYQKIADKPYRDAYKLYNGMIYPLLESNIKGVVWLQGSSNRWNAGCYASMLENMIKLWRNNWKNHLLPFYICNLTPNHYKKDVGFENARIIEAQIQVANKDSDVHVIPMSDLGKPKFIHFPKKREAALRVTASVLANTYGVKGIPAEAPIVDKIEYNEGKAFVYFKNANRGLVPMYQDIDCFELAGEDKIFHSANAMIDVHQRNRVIVSCNQVENPKYVRYAFSNWHVTMLYGNEGLPALPFRTDNIKF